MNELDILVACSGGLDSTVLAHSVAMTRTLKGSLCKAHIVYINHGLRPDDEIFKDISHVNSLGVDLKYSSIKFPRVHLRDGNTQAMARSARYDALTREARVIGAKVLLAHHANDVAETKLWQFLTGRPTVGIEPSMIWDDTQLFLRPFLPITREELSTYAKAWSLEWSEDSSNSSDKYVRNIIRSELIPFIEDKINPGIIRMLSM